MLSVLVLTILQERAKIIYLASHFISYLKKVLPGYYCLQAICCFSNLILHSCFFVCVTSVKLKIILLFNTLLQTREKGNFIYSGCICKLLFLFNKDRLLSLALILSFITSEDMRTWSTSCFHTREIGSNWKEEDIASFFLWNMSFKC